MNLNEFLSLKPLFYEEIDYERFPNVYKKYKEHFKLPKIVHVVGTNAKGSTGRALAQMLHVKGFKVGHYSSPHIINFNERIWINGENIHEDILESTHKNLQKILNKEDLKILSYFEYTTLLAMLIFTKECEYIILEAGLGGEFDATNVFEKDLSIITPIGYDHESFLGNSIDEIANTKLRSINNDVVLAKQHEIKVYDLALKRVDDIKKDLYFAKSFLEDAFYEKLKIWVKDKGYPRFFYDNFSSAFCAFKLLGFEPDINLLNDLKIFGRCQKIAPNITIDVGHNPMAAYALFEHFDKRKVVLIYNSYNDKEYTKILEILKPTIEEVQIIEISNDREVQKKDLEKVLKLKNIKYSNFKKIDNEKEYLVFGSFSVVEQFLMRENLNEKNLYAKC